MAVLALDDTEEAFWRALMRVVVALPRTLEADLMRSTGLTMTEMLVLVSLADAPAQQLRMSQLADVTTLSASRVTRLVTELQRRGLVSKRVSQDDGRGYVAELTAHGRAEIKRTYPGRLRSARRCVLDHVEPAALPVVIESLERILVGLDAGSETGARS